MPNDVAVELYYDSAWNNIVPDDDVFADTPIVITRGQGDESAAPRPASISMRLANDDDMYRTSNPESPLYGKAGRNTPVRVSVGGVVRGVVEASSWKAGQTRDFRRYPKRGKAWVDFEGGGLLQRINQWTEPLKSPFRQYNETITQAVGYWPLEQDRGSTSVVSTVAGTKQSGAFFGMAFDSQYRPPSSAPLMDVGEDGELGQFFAPTGTDSSTAGWQLSWVSRLETLAAGENYIMNWDTADGTVYSLVLNSTTGQMTIYSARGGSAILSYSVTYSGYDWTQWTMFSVDAAYSGGTTTIYVNWTNADNSESGFITTTYSGVTSSLSKWSITGIAGDVPADSTYGHVLGVNVDHSGVDLFGLDRTEAWTGYAGETAEDRFTRLCLLKNISAQVYSTAGYTSTAMGPQGVDTLAGHFREIAATEDGLIFDSVDSTQVTLLTRGARYNQTPTLTLNAASDSHGMPSLPTEVTDDLDVHNIVTASQRDGGEYTVEDSTSLLGTQDPPNGVGEYRQTVDVNVHDETNDLPQQANWWLRRGTVNLPRFPRVVVNLAALDAATVVQVEAVDVGSVIEITNYRENTIRLFVLGYTEVIGWPNDRTITFVCAPDRQFQVGQWDSTSSLWDLKTCTMSTAANPSATTLTLAITSYDETWSSTSAYDLMISGEVIGVPIGGMGARSGSGPYTQTLTGAVRSKNGIRKTLPAGAEVHAAIPGRWAI